MLRCYCWLFFSVSKLNAEENEKKQEKFGWTKNLIGTANLTQSYFDNWTQGGENSVAWKAIVETKWENNQQKYNWRNSGKIVYGQLKQGKQDVRKSDDELKLESVLLYKVGKFLNPYFALNVETQLTKGYLYEDLADNTIQIPVSDFFSPAFLRQSLGLGYRPNENFVTRLGLSLKETIVKRDSISFEGKSFPIRTIYNKNNATVRVETGIESTTDISRKLGKKLLFNSKLELFTSFEEFDTIDINWENTFIAKISKIFAVTLNVRLFFDKDQDSDVQYKQVLGFGVLYTFF